MQRIQVGDFRADETDHRRVSTALAHGREAEVADARLRLNRELGVRASGIPRVEGQRMPRLDDLQCERLQGPRLLDVQDLWQRVSQSWPELAALRMRLQGAEAETQRQERAALPPLSLVLGYTHQFQQQAIGFPDADSFGFGFRVGLPVFDQNQGAIHSAQSRVRELRAQIESMELDLRAEMESDLVRVRASFDVLQNIDRDALQAAARASTRILEAYALGGRSLLETLDVQRVLREVQAEYIDACASARIAFLRLQILAGESLVADVSSAGEGERP